MVASIKFRAFWDVVPYSHAEKLTDISEVHLPPSSGVEAVYTSEMSVNFNVTTRRYIPEDSNFQFSTWIHFSFIHKRSQQGPNFKVVERPLPP
jgi:hypothetical protein